MLKKLTLAAALALGAAALAGTSAQPAAAENIRSARVLDHGWVVTAGGGTAAEIAVLLALQLKIDLPDLLAAGIESRHQREGVHQVQIGAGLVGSANVDGALDIPPAAQQFQLFADVPFADR